MTLVMESRERFADAADPQLTFQIVNHPRGLAQATNILYITNDAQFNQAELQITLNTGSVKLTPAAEISDPTTIPPAGSGTLLYLDLSSLDLGTALFSQIQPAAPGWKFTLFASQSVIGMTPVKAVTLSSGPAGAISIALGMLEIAQTPSTPVVQLFASYFNVPEVTGEFGSFAVAVQARPDGSSGNLADAIAVSLSSSAIINSDALRIAANSFQLQLSAAPGAPQVSAGDNTVFAVSFVYGKPGDPFGYGALMDATFVSDGNVSVTAGDNADGWQITLNASLQSPDWTLQPPAGEPLVGTGVEAVVSFQFAGIETTYQPGPTALLVAYTSVPGFQDGVYTLILDKVAHVIIDSLSVTPNPSFFQNVGGTEEAPVTVQWQTRHAESLQLKQNFASQTLPPSQTEQAVTLTTGSTTFTLQASGRGGPVNVDTRNVRATVLPVINSFAGAPSEIYAGQTSHAVTLSWAVDTTGQVTISSSALQSQPQLASANQTLTDTVTEPQVFTIAPVAADNLLTLTRRVVVSAFQPQVGNFSLPAASGIVASPTAPFAALTNASGNQIVVVDTVQYAQIATVAVGASPAAIAISRDGSLLVTANEGDGTISVVQVTLAQAGTPSFGPASPVEVGGVPRRIFITPDNGTIYVTVDAAAGQAGQLVSVSATAGQYAVAAEVTVGQGPRGLAVESSGARIYVANSADDTISVIGAQEGVLAVTNLIESVTGTPEALAVTPDGLVLLATCVGSGTVVVIDATFPNTGNRQTLTVGAQPRSIGLTPGGAYAFVANEGDGTISLIDCSYPTFDAATLPPTIPVGSSPADVAVSADGLVVLAATATGLSVVTLRTYESPQVIANVVAQPTDVAAAPDGSCALVWHNAMLGGLPLSGASCYSTASSLLTPILSNVPIVQCVFHPDPSAHRAFAVDGEGATLHVLDMTVPQQPVDAQQQIAGAFGLIAIAISGDGQLLYVVSADASLRYTLLVLSSQQGSWTPQQTIPLYQGKTPGEVLLQATPDASALFVIDAANGVFKAVTRGSGAQYQMADLSVQVDQPSALAVLPDGSKAFIVNRGSPPAMVVVDIGAAVTAEVVSLFGSFMNLEGLIASPDGRFLYATDVSAGALRILDPASLRILQTLDLAADISQAQGANGVTVLPDASRIFAVSTVSGTMSIFTQIPMNS